MCKFCEFDNPLEPIPLIESDISLDFDTHSYIHPALIAHTIVDAGQFGEYELNSMFNINYCPICGRRLTREPVEEENV